MDIISNFTNWLLGGVGGVLVYFFTAQQDHSKRILIIESKMDTLHEMKQDLKELKEYVHKTVHESKNRDNYINPLIEQIYRHLNKID